MATRSLLYHAFVLKGYRILSAQYEKGITIFHIKIKKFKRRCAVCGSHRITKVGRFAQVFKEVPIGNRLTRLVLHGHR